MTEIEDMITDGLLTVEDIIQDIQLEELFKSRCPICGHGDVIGKCCDFCAWEYENEEGWMQESNHIGSSTGGEIYDTLLKKFGLENYKSPYMKNISVGKPVKTGPLLQHSTGVMNAGLQKYNLERKLKRELGDGADYHDAEALIDSGCHYDENLKMILPKLGIDSSGKTPEEKAADDEERALDHECEVTGKDRETILAENKAKTEADLYESIHTLANINTFHEFENAGEIRNIRVTSLFKKSTVKALLDIMSKKFRGVEYTHYLIHRLGMYMFEQDLKACNIGELRHLDGEVRRNFSDPRVEKTHVFSIRGRVLRGSSGEDINLYYCKKQKNQINDLCSQEKYDLYETDLSYICFIYASNSYFNNSKDAELSASLEHAHFYTGEEFISDVRNCIVDYRNSFINHFIDILPILKEEYTSRIFLLELLKQDPKAYAEYKKLNPNIRNINAENVKRKGDTISKIEKFLKINLDNKFGYTVNSRLDGFI